MWLKTSWWYVSTDELKKNIGWENASYDSLFACDPGHYRWFLWFTTAVPGFALRFLQEFNVEKDFDVKNKYQKAGHNFCDTLGVLLREGPWGSKEDHLFSNEYMQFTRPGKLWQFAIENGPVEIVDFLINSMVIFQFAMLNYQRVQHFFFWSMSRFFAGIWYADFAGLLGGLKETHQEYVEFRSILVEENYEQAGEIPRLSAGPRKSLEGLTMSMTKLLVFQK
jgi:hypothetical protein